MRPGEMVRVTFSLGAEEARLLHQRLGQVRSDAADQLAKASHEREVAPITKVVGALGVLSAAIYGELQRPEVQRELARKTRPMRP